MASLIVWSCPLARTPLTAAVEVHKRLPRTQCAASGSRAAVAPLTRRRSRTRCCRCLAVPQAIRQRAHPSVVVGTSASFSCSHVMTAVGTGPARPLDATT
eukprot:1384830-Alexandrium_andersonii.AAC.1